MFQILTKLINDLKYSDFARYVFEFAVIKAANISSLINLLDGESHAAAPVKKEVSAPVKASENADRPVKQETISQEKSADNEPAPVLKGSNEGIWTRILNIASSKNPMIYAMLQHARLIEDTAEHLSISFPLERKFQYNQLKSGNSKDIFENIVFTVSEKHTKIDIELDSSIENSKKKALI